MQALAQVRIGLAHHPGAGIGLHTLDRGLGSEARQHDLAHATQPALVMGEHAKGLEHVTMLAGMGDIAALDQLVDRGAHLADRSLEPRHLGSRILGDEIGDGDARLVQHRMAEADAVGQRDTDAVDRPVESNGCTGCRQGLQPAGRDHLRHDHGGGLQRLDFLLGIDPGGAVLNDEHAHHGAAPQDRHAEEGTVDLFACLRTIGEGRMRLRIRESERLGLAGDQADEPLAGAHGGEVHRLAIETFGCVEFERAILAQDVNRADFGDEIAGDQDDKPVQSLLRADGRGHHLAEAAQQNARSSESASHRSQPSARLLSHRRYDACPDPESPTRIIAPSSDESPSSARGGCEGSDMTGPD